MSPMNFFFYLGPKGLDHIHLTKKIANLVEAKNTWRFDFDVPFLWEVTCRFHVRQTKLWGKDLGRLGYNIVLLEMILQISCSICFNKNIYLQVCSYTISKLISNKFQWIQFSYKSITLTYIHPWNKSYKDYDQQKHVSHITLQNKKHAPKLSLEAGLAFQGFVIFSEIMVEVALKVGCTPFIGPPGAPQADRKIIPQKECDTNPTGTPNPFTYQLSYEKNP